MLYWLCVRFEVPAALLLRNHLRMVRMTTQHHFPEDLYLCDNLLHGVQNPSLLKNKRADVYSHLIVQELVAYFRGG